MALVFQYGSNADSARLNSSERLRGDAHPVGIAKTEDNFELDFTVRSEGNKCAAADMVPGGGRKIWGVLYEIPDYLITRETAKPLGRKSLDAIEGEGSNYTRISIALRYPDGRAVERDVITYVVRCRIRNQQTSLAYVSHIIRGLRQHYVPDEYIEYVKRRVIANNHSLETAIEAL